MNRVKTTNIAIIGCGYVADFYLNTLKDYPELKVSGIYDKQPDRMEHLAREYGHPTYNSLDELLKDDEVSIVVNLTNPGSHYEINRAALEAGKHVYSEKPFAMEFQNAKKLYRFAREKELTITSAPCSLLGEQAQTMWKALREQKIGDVWLVHAELDEGPVHLMEPEKWRSASGLPWPVKDEFEVGCTLEHAGYYLPWLAAWFGPAEKLTAFSSCRIPDKNTADSLQPDDTPDFSVAIITFKSGVVARLTCSILGEHNHDMKIYGEKGILAIDECWNYGDPVRLHYYNKRAMNGEKYPFVRNSKLLKKLYNINWEKLPFVKEPDQRTKWQNRRPAMFFMDYARGIKELADSLDENRPCRLSPELSLHVNELTLAIQNAGENGLTYKVETTFDYVEPMPWAS